MSNPDPIRLDVRSPTTLAADEWSTSKVLPFAAAALSSVFLWMCTTGYFVRHLTDGVYLQLLIIAEGVLSAALLTVIQISLGFILVSIPQRHNVFRHVGSWLLQGLIPQWLFAATFLLILQFWYLQPNAFQVLLYVASLLLLLSYLAEPWVRLRPFVRKELYRLIRPGLRRGRAFVFRLINEFILVIFYGLVLTLYAGAWWYITGVFLKFINNAEVIVARENGKVIYSANLHGFVLPTLCFTNQSEQEIYVHGNQQLRMNEAILNTHVDGEPVKDVNFQSIGCMNMLGAKHEDGLFAYSINGHIDDSYIPNSGYVIACEIVEARFRASDSRCATYRAQHKTYVDDDLRGRYCVVTKPCGLFRLPAD